MSTFMSDWALIGVAILAIWILCGMLSLVFNLIDYAHAAARASREESSANRERGSFL